MKRFLFVLFAVPVFFRTEIAYLQQEVDWAKIELQALEFILPEKALKFYQSLSDSEKIEWATRYWKAMDPTPTTPHNEYYEEFRRRVRYAYQNFHNLVPPYFMDDRARYYIRFGPPDDQVISSGLGKKYRSNITWAYYTMNLFVDFVEYDAFGYREVPDLSVAVQGYPGAEKARIASELYLERADLSPRYLAFQDVRNDLQYFSEVQTFTQDKKLALEKAPPVRFEFKHKALPLNVHIASCVFRGRGGRSRVELYFSIPLDELSFQPDPEKAAWVARLQKSIILYDQLYREQFLESTELPLYVRQTDNLRGRAYVGQHNFELEPGTYQLALRIEHRTGNRLAILKSGLRVRSFPPGELSVSDVQFAHKIFLNAKGKYVKANGIQVVPYISTTILREKPVLIYFEIYGLTLNQKGRTRFKVEYRVEHLGETTVLAEAAARIASFFRGHRQEPVVGTRFETEGQSEFEQIYSNLDLSNVPAGKKQLVIQVTDLIAGKTAEIRKLFYLK
jgi:GWxTD domain-containing protein